MGTSNNGVIITHGGGYLNHCQFVGEDLTSAATAVSINNETTIKNGRIFDCYFIGEVSNMTGIEFNNASRWRTKDCYIHNCLVGVKQVHVDSDYNVLNGIDFDDCAVAIDLYAGNRMHVQNINFDNCTVNVSDDINDQIYENIQGELAICICPENLTGVTLTGHADAATWGESVIIRTDISSDRPFSIVGYYANPLITQDHLIRLSADGDVTYFDIISIGSVKSAATNFSAGTKFIFNKNTQITGALMAESGSNDTMKFWLKLQEI